MEHAWDLLLGSPYKETPRCWILGIPREVAGVWESGDQHPCFCYMPSGCPPELSPHSASSSSTSIMGKSCSFHRKGRMHEEEYLLLQLPRRVTYMLTVQTHANRVWSHAHRESLFDEGVLSSKLLKGCSLLSPSPMTAFRAKQKSWSTETTVRAATHALLPEHKSLGGGRSLQHWDRTWPSDAADLDTCHNHLKWWGKGLGLFSIPGTEYNPEPLMWVSIVSEMTQSQVLQELAGKI